MEFCNTSTIPETVKIGSALLNPIIEAKDSLTKDIGGLNSCQCFACGLVRVP